MFNNVFKNKVVIVTGHTGFKGSWLIIWLKMLGAKVVGISLDPLSQPSHYELIKTHVDMIDLRIDVRDKIKIENEILKANPDFVFHLAAQALVKYSYENPIETWDTNVIGTANVLEALKKINKKCTSIFITSDKCYRNVEWIWGYRENDTLGGIDPYSASKAAAEILIHSYTKSFFSSEFNLVQIGSARAGNVIGGGDWSSDRLIPDCVKAWSKNETVVLRNPNSTRPWQHVLEPISGYLLQAATLSSDKNLHGEAFNFGPHNEANHSVLDVVKQMALDWDLVKWHDASQEIINKHHEAGLLKLNCDKALSLLNWKPTMSFVETVKMTSDWYKSYYKDPKLIYSKSIEQINLYSNLAKHRDANWTI